jgi:hypothetical protein
MDFSFKYLINIYEQNHYLDTFKCKSDNKNINHVRIKKSKTDKERFVEHIKENRMDYRQV